MEGELVSSSLFQTGDDVPQEEPHYSQTFHEQFPYYIAFGMSAAEYWDGDPILVRDYRRAHKIKRQMDNQQAWLQGLYFYDALGAMAPVLRAFAKAGTKALPYVKEPFPLETENKSKAEEESHDKKVYDKGMAWMRALMAGTKKKYGKKGGNADGNDDR